MPSGTEYVKINAPWKRDKKGKFREEWSTPELEFLQDNDWLWRAKIDGTNIRIIINRDEDGTLAAWFGGRTDRAETPQPLIRRLIHIFDDPNRRKAMDECFNYLKSDETIVLYGEGFGAGINKGGDYGPVDFILFDITVEGQWLKQEAVEDIADRLDIQCVPIVGFGTINEAASMIDQMAHGVPTGNVKFGSGWKEHRDMWPDKEPEGIVLAPRYGANLFDRKGNRILTKLKLKDYR